MSKRDELKKEVREVIVNSFAADLGKTSADFEDDTDPTREYGATSTMIIHVVLALQDKYMFTVNFMPFRRQKTIEEMVDYIMDEVFED